MVELNLVNSNEVDVNRVQDDLNNGIELLLYVNPVYDWFEENINNINYKLLKGFITNIIPLGDSGKRYFKKIAHGRVGFTAELWKLYNQLEKIHRQGNLKIASYSKLYSLGYDDVWLGGECPIDDILNYLKET